MSIGLDLMNDRSDSLNSERSLHKSTKTYLYYRSQQGPYLRLQPIHSNHQGHQSSASLFASRSSCCILDCKKEGEENGGGLGILTLQRNKSSEPSFQSMLKRMVIARVRRCVSDLRKQTKRVHA